MAERLLCSYQLAMRTLCLFISLSLVGCARAACPEAAPSSPIPDARTPSVAAPLATNPSDARVIDSTGASSIEWTEEERQKDIALRPALVNEQLSAFWILARGAERPHVHERTDMLVFVVSGRVEMHVGAQTISATRGDVIEVPKGTPHWVENVHPTGSVAYAVFSPPFDGTDRRFLDEPAASGDPPAP